MKKCLLLTSALAIVLLFNADVNANTLSSGDILVTDFTKEAVIRVNPITGSQTLITSNGFFVRPRGIAIDTNGNIFVADDAAFDNRLPNGSGSKGGIIRVDPITGLQVIVSSNGFFRAPLEIAIDSYGDIIVSDYNTHPYGAILRIDQFTGDQSVVSWGEPFAAFRGIGLESTGDIIVSDSGANSIIRVNVLTGLQTLVSSSGLFSTNYGITIEKNGSILVTDYGLTDSIIRVNPLTGAQTILSTGGYLQEPIGITIEKNGNVLVTDRGINGIIRIDSVTGEQSLVSINGFFTDLWGIAVVPAPEPDIDNDGILNEEDNCPDIPNPDQFDTDLDTFGDACDEDDDNDGVLDTEDNCPLHVNEDQSDFDGDGYGNACDDDIDGDGINDGEDQCLNTAYDETVNPDGCSINDICSCGNEWKNHGSYVVCVSKTSTDFLSEGLIDGLNHGNIVSEAASSDCGY